MPVPGRADPERDRVVADRVDVALLVDGLGRDAVGAVRPDHVAEDRRRALVLVERGRDRPDRPRRDLVALRDQLGQLLDHLPADLRRRARSPSSVSTLPRRNTSQSRWPSSAFSTASSEPASSAATAGSSVICSSSGSRAGQPASRSLTSSLTRARRRARRLRHHRRHHLAHLLLATARRSRASASATSASSSSSEICAGQVGVDHRRLGLLGRGRSARPPLR